MDEELFKRLGIGGDDEDIPEGRSSSGDTNRFMESPMSQTTSLEHEGGTGTDGKQEGRGLIGDTLLPPKAKAREKRKRTPDKQTVCF